MKKMNSLKAAAVYMMVAFVGMFVGVSLVSCDRDDVTGHDNNGNAAMSITVKPDTTKPEPKPEPTPQPVLTDSVWGKVVDDSLIIVHDSLRNDTVFKTETVSLGFSAKISRKDDERKTTVERIKKLDFSFEDAQNKQNGKLQFIGSQNGNDADGQSYTLDFASEKLSKWGLSNVHFELVGTNTPEVKNNDIEKKASDSIRIKSEMTWPLTVKVVNVPNLEGKEFKSSILNKTNHERYISYGDAVLVKRDTTMTPTYGIWSTEWLLKVVETYRVNGHDSIAPAQTKKVTLVSTCGIDKNEDAFVSSLEYSHNFTSEKWGNWYDVESADKAVSVQERKFERLGVGSNGIEKDKFNTKSYVTEQKATVVFAGLTWNIPATNATLTNVRHTFLDEASDLDGYSMIKFVDDEIATYAGATEGNNYKKLNSSCKLYLKLTPIELDKIEFAGTKVHTNGMAKIDGSVIPVYSDGSKGAAISFKFEKAEQWYWKNDSVIAEGVTFVMQETGTLKLKGSESKTAKTFATSNENITIKCNQYDADFQTTVNVDGQTKVTTWHATWYEDFKVCYEGKEVSLTKSSYNVKNQNDKLTKDEARSTAVSEVWGYSVDGIFNIDEDSRSAYGYGRITKAITEEVVTEYWDKFTFQTDAHEYTDRVEYFLKWIREYNTGKKTSTDVKIVLKRNAEGSTYTITVEDPEREIGSQSEETSLVARSESANDIVVSYDWLTSKFELPNVFDGNKTKNDIATFVDPTNVKVTKKNAKGEDVTIELPSFEHQLTSTVSDLQMVSETEELVSYTYTRTWNWASTQCTSTAKSIGNINKIPEYGGGEPDFDIEVGKIIATVSRPSNRNASDITAYTYLLVSKDGKKCVPFGIYHGVVTEGKITDWNNNVYGKGKSYNGACYVKDANEVVPTYSVAEGGFVKWYGANGIVDAAKEITLQGAGFNDRGNDCINHTGKYAPRVEKQGNVVKVTFSDTNVSYTFRGWDVK